MLVTNQVAHRKVVRFVCDVGNLLICVFITLLWHEQIVEWELKSGNGQSSIMSDLSLHLPEVWEQNSFLCLQFMGINNGLVKLVVWKLRLGRPCLVTHACSYNVLVVSLVSTLCKMEQITDICSTVRFAYLYGQNMLMFKVNCCS